ncbi:MAG: hypothetical protein Q7T71_04995 [Herbiconiux sp.]|nr:hypothetical protein [Herbiconiux sp.]
MSAAARRPAAAGAEAGEGSAIALPRILLVGLAAVFSAFHVVLGVSTLDVPQNPVPSIVAMALYAVATALSLALSPRVRMPAAVAAGNLAVAAVGLLLVLSQLDPDQHNGYATWIVGAVGTLMTITVVRLRPSFAWAGIAILIAAVLIWARDPLDLPALGAIGGPVWVAVGHATTVTIARASRETRRYERAEQRAAEWHAQEEAEFFERRVRLAQMNRQVAPMLRRIVTGDGMLDEEARRECLHLEAAMRDEIRGRRLLDDGVRQEVLAARRRGVEVTLLDDGGIDDLDRAAHARITAAIARQLGHTTADRVVVRTAQHDTEVAVTIVGLRDPDPAARAAGDDEAELELWVELPRTES